MKTLPVFALVAAVGVTAAFAVGSVAVASVFFVVGMVTVAFGDYASERKAVPAYVEEMANKTLPLAA